MPAGRDNKALAQYILSLQDSLLVCRDDMAAIRLWDSGLGAVWP